MANQISVERVPCGLFWGIIIEYNPRTHKVVTTLSCHSTSHICQEVVNMGTAISVFIINRPSGVTATTI